MLVTAPANRMPSAPGKQAAVTAGVIPPPARAAMLASAILEIGLASANLVPWGG
jgi:hypothetical protein